jgi:DNA-binding GntR family transcriptional regulator
MTAHLHRIESSPDLVEQVYSALLDAISTGTLQPGQRITQEELAEQLAVSRQPVMQALRLLRKDGFVRDAPLLNGDGQRTRGLQVAPLDPQQIAQVYEVRSALDQLAVRLAASQRARIDPAVFRSGLAAARRGDVKALIDADMAFHTAIYRAAGNPFIEQSAQLHWQHIRRAMGLALQSDLVRKPVWEEHQAIAEAIATGDGEHAALIMAEHTGKAAQMLTDQLADPADGGGAPAGTEQLRGRRRQPLP